MSQSCSQALYRHRIWHLFVEKPSCTYKILHKRFDALLVKKVFARIADIVYRSSTKIRNVPTLIHASNINSEIKMSSICLQPESKLNSVFIYTILFWGRKLLGVLKTWLHVGPLNYSNSCIKRIQIFLFC